MRRLLAVLLGTMLVAVACGKVGPIRPPGPPEEVTFPRNYPNR